MCKINFLRTQKKPPQNSMCSHLASCLNYQSEVVFLERFKSHNKHRDWCIRTCLCVSTDCINILRNVLTLLWTSECSLKCQIKMRSCIVESWQWFVLVIWWMLCGHMYGVCSRDHFVCTSFLPEPLLCTGKCLYLSTLYFHCTSILPLKIYWNTSSTSVLSEVTFVLGRGQ